MQITLNVTDFAKKFAQGASMASKNQQNPIFENVLVQIKNGKALVTSSNIETTIVKRCDVFCEEEGEFCINPQDLLSVIKTLNGEDKVVIEVFENRAVLSHSKGKVTLPLADAREFQKPIVDDEIKYFDVNSEVLSSLMKEARNFTAKDEIRPIMCGVRLICERGSLRASSTDSNVLYDNRKSIENKVDGEFEIVIGSNVIPSLLSAIDGTEITKIGKGVSNMVFKTTDCKIITRNMNGKYPNVDSVIPKTHSITIKVNKSELANAISRLIVTANLATKTIVFETNNGSLRITSEDLDYAKKSFEEFNGIADGENIRIGVNGIKLQTCLSQINGTEAVFEMNDSRHAIVVKENHESEKTMLVMPVNIC